jgi:hypothetical protein
MAVRSSRRLRGGTGRGRTKPGVVLVAAGLVVTCVSGYGVASGAPRTPKSWTAATAIPTAETGGQPALAVFKGKLYAAWLGATTGQIFYSAFNGTKWTAQATVPSALTAAYKAFRDSKWSLPNSITGGSAGYNGQALAVFDKMLYAAWPSLSTSDVSYAAFDGIGWTATSSIPSSPTEYGPALAVYDGSLYIAWEVFNGSYTGPIDYSSGP